MEAESMQCLRVAILDRFKHFNSYYLWTIITVIMTSELFVSFEIRCIR